MLYWTLFKNQADHNFPTSQPNARSRHRWCQIQKYDFSDCHSFRHFFIY